MKKRDSNYKTFTISISKEVCEILEDIIKGAKSKGHRINRSQLIESMIYDSLHSTYIQSELLKKKEEVN